MGLLSFLNPMDMLGGGGGGGGSSFSGGGAFNKESTNQNYSQTATNEYSNNTTLGNGASYVGNGGSYDASTKSWLSNYINDSSTHWTDASVRNSTSFEVNDSSSRDYSDRSTSNWWQDNSSSIQVNDSSSRDYSDRSSKSWDNSVRNSTSFQVNDSSTHDYSDRSTLNYDGSNRSTTSITNTGTDAAQIVRLNAGLLQSVSENNGETVRALAKMGFDTLGQSTKAATDLFASSSAEASAAWGHTVDKAAELIDSLMTTTRTTVADTLQASQNFASKAIASTPDAASSTTVRFAIAGAAVVVLAVLFLRKG